MGELLFRKYPLPWEIEYDGANCIFDAKGKCIVSTDDCYSAFDVIWELYSVLTDKQKIELGGIIESSQNEYK